MSERPQALSRTPRLIAKAPSALGLLGLLVGAAHSQPVQEIRPGSSFHPDSSYTAESLIRNARRQAQDGQWAEAIDLFQRVVEQHGDSLAEITSGAGGARAPGPGLFVNARRYAQLALSQLAPEGLAAYRQRFDTKAEALYRRGVQENDDDSLRTLVDLYFCTSWADQALEVLGDRAFRDGRFHEALSAYRALTPDPALDAQPGTRLIHGDTDVDLARVRAKLLLSRAAAGDPPTETDLENFARDFPDARGSIAGRTGLLFECVKQALKEDNLGPTPTQSAAWPTFAGDSARNGQLADRVDVGSFQWKVSLNAPRPDRAALVIDDARAMTAPLRPRGLDEQDPNSYPIIVGELVIVAEDDRVTAYSLAARPQGSGDDEIRKQVMVWEQRPPVPGGVVRTARAGLRPVKNTLTASGDRVFARLGGTSRGTGGVLLAIRSNREIEGKLLWKKNASEIDLPKKGQGNAMRGLAMLEGTPVAAGERVYVAITELSTETWFYVACLDAETGRALWVRYLGSGTSAFDPARGLAFGANAGNRLLSLQGDSLVYQTNLGAVACLDADSGDVRWLATYTARDQNTTPELKRSPNPAILADGLALIAPEDAPEIFAFELGSGRLVWKSQPIPQAVHLLGVAGGKLFATGDHLYTLSASNGQVLRVWPDAGPGGFPGHGRGMLAGGMIYWPTRTEILVLDQETGGDVHTSIPLFQSFGHGGGNLAAGGGFLAVAQRESLVVYCENRRLIERYQQQIAQEPDRAIHHYLLARALEADGQDQAALRSHREAERLVRAGDLLESNELAPAIRKRQYDLLIKLADAAQARTEFPDAEKLLREAMTKAENPRALLEAHLRLAEVLATAGRVAAAVAVLQDVITNEPFRDLTITPDDFRRLRADLWVADKLTALVAQHGREIYAEFDARAASLLEKGRAGRDPRPLREIARSYPLASVVPESFLALADLETERGELAEATNSYKRLFELASDDAHRARALLGLVEIYIRRGWFDLGRETALRALDRYGACDLKSTGLDGTLASRLASLSPLFPGDHSLSDDAALVALPFEPLWNKALAEDEQLLNSLEQRGATAGGAQLVLLIKGRSIQALDTTNGQPLWTRALDEEPVWNAPLGESVLVASVRDIQALDRETGHPLWSFAAESAPAEASPPNPFSRASAPSRSAPQSTRLHGFRVLGSRVYFLRGSSQLIALDATQGRPEWTFSARIATGDSASVGINPFWLLLDGRAVIEVGRKNACMVLDTRTGAVLAEFERGEDEPPWCADPVALDDQRVAVAIDPRTFVMIDLNRAVDIWTYRDPSALPRSTPPRLWAGEGVLLALLGGQELMRIDAGTGRPIWSRPLGLTNLAAAPDALAYDDHLVYLARPSLLEAIRLDSGQPLWSRRMQDHGQGGSVRLLGPFVLVYPRFSERAVPFEAAGVLLCRRDTGAPVQSIPMRGPVNQLDVSVSPTTMLVSTQDQLSAWSRMTPRP